MADTIPTPPVPIGELKSKKSGFLGMFRTKNKSKKKTASRDVDAGVLASENQIAALEKESKREEDALDKEKIKLQEMEQKELDPSSQEFSSLENELEPPKEEQRTNPEKEVDLDDLEKLERDLEDDGSTLKKVKSQAKKGEDLDLPEIEIPEIEPPEPVNKETIEKVKKVKTAKKEKAPKIKISKVSVPKMSENKPSPLDKETTKLIVKKTKAKKVAPPTKIAKPIKEKPVRLDIDSSFADPISTSVEVREPVSLEKPKVIKIRPKQKIERHFKGLESDHKKIYADIHKTIESPYQKIDPAHFFVLKNGQTVKSLRELILALEIVDEHTFKHHVNAQKNDFANWVKDILKKEQLAENIRNKTAKAELLKVLSDHDKQVQQTFMAQKTVANAWKKEQLKLIDKVRKARDELYDMQAELDARTIEIEKKAKLVAKSKAFNVEAYKKQLQKALKDKQKQLQGSLEAARAAVRKEKTEVATQKNELLKKQNQISSLEKNYNKELKTINTQKESLKKQQQNVANSLKQSREKEAQMKTKTADLARREKALLVKERVIERKEEKVKEMYMADQDLKATLDSMQQKIDEQKTAIEAQGFQEYVREELAQLYTKHATQVTNIDGRLDMIGSKHADIHEMITECRKYLNQNKISDAQKLYNHIKDEFSKRSIAPIEKTKLHRQILELYDDIHLALMR